MEKRQHVQKFYGLSTESVMFWQNEVNNNIFLIDERIKSSKCAKIKHEKFLFYLYVIFKESFCLSVLQIGLF